MLEIYQEDADGKLKEIAADDLADALWSRVAVKRGRGRWSRAAWAVRFGYSSYTRFQRACLAEYGVSPVEMERGVMEEILSNVEGPKSKVEGREEVRITKDEVRTADCAGGAVLERQGELGVEGKRELRESYDDAGDAGASS